MTSRSTRSTAEPINSTVTVEAAQGILSPLLISNTRQSLRKSIMGLFQLLDLVEKLVRLLELPVNARVPNVGHLVQAAQFAHHLLADLAVRNVIASEARGQIAINPISHFA